MHFPTAETGVVYSPRNYDGRYRGPLLARRALAGSENIPAVALASELGVPKLLRFLRRAGFSTFEKTAAHYGLGVTLGNAEVRLDELVAAYSAFARDGEWREPTWLSSGPPAFATRPLVSPRTAFWVSDILSDAEARAFIFGRGGSLEFPFTVAVKTGTSQAYHDNWTIGFTRKLTVGVWVGNFDRRPLRNSSGVTGAAPIFHAVMLAAHDRFEHDDQPLALPDETLVERQICALSGGTATEWCPIKRRELLPDDAHRAACSWHQLTDAGLIVSWPGEYREWARQNNQPSLIPAHSAARITHADVRAVRATPPPRELQIVSPPSGATFLIDPTLRPEFQTLRLKVVTASPSRIEWSVDGTALGTSTSEQALDWVLRTGEHRFEARDAVGNRSQASVTVR
jgi:penicillin-binding protein 1C